MPLFAIVGHDKADHLDKRLETRDAHLDHLRSLGERLMVAGPILDGDGKPMGSIIVIEAGSIEDAREFVASDPYTGIDLFEWQHVHPWSPALGEWVAPSTDEEE